MAKNVTCKYRITATVKADTIYEREAIKERLIGLGQRSFASTPLRSSQKSLKARQSVQLDLEGPGRLSLT